METSLEKRISNAARKARVSRGWTQEEAAEQIGVSVEFYSRIERGAALPSLKTFVRMAIAFGIGADTLLGMAEDEEAQQLIKEYSAQPADDPPGLKRIMRRLRQTDEELHGSVNRMVAPILTEIEKIAKNAGKEEKPGKKKGKSAAERRSSQKAGDDSEE